MATTLTINTHLLRDIRFACGFSPYTPLFLLVHAPFGLLSHYPSQLSYFVLTIALTLVLAWLSLWMCGRSPTLASVTGIAAMVLVSRPGHLESDARTDHFGVRVAGIYRPVFRFAVILALRPRVGGGDDEGNILPAIDRLDDRSKAIQGCGDRSLCCGPRNIGSSRRARALGWGYSNIRDHVLGQCSWFRK